MASEEGGCGISPTSLRETGSAHQEEGTAIHARTAANSPRGAAENENGLELFGSKTLTLRTCRFGLPGNGRSRQCAAKGFAFQVN